MRKHANRPSGGGMFPSLVCRRNAPWEMGSFWRDIAAPIGCRTLETQMFKSDAQCNSLLHIHKNFSNN